MKYVTIFLILFATTILVDEPIQIAAMGRGTGRIYARGTGGDVGNHILREDGSHLLREDGSKFVRE